MKRLLGHQLVHDSFARNTWVTHLPTQTTRGDLLRAPFWADVADKLRKGDKIQVYADDSTWFAELVVRKSVGKMLTLGELAYVDHSAATGSPTSAVGTL